jgi:hypothetical protein
MRFNATRTAAFCNAFLSANVSYFATRRQLFTLFTDSIDPAGILDVPNAQFITIRTFLTARTRENENDARLACEVAVLELLVQATNVIAHVP